MTNFDALKQIYEALGGDEEITGTNLDALKAIAEVAGSGGGGGGGLVVHDTESSGVHTLDKTWKEIHDAMSAGGSVVVVAGSVDEGYYTLCGVVCEFTLGTYSVSILTTGGGSVSYETLSETGYPSYTPGP